jgi:MSHA biogenesis protein MshJ
MRPLAQLSAWARSFDRLSQRERLLVLGAVVALLIGAWQLLLTGHMEARRRQLLEDLTTLETAMGLAAKTAAATTAADPANTAAGRISELQARLQSVDGQLLARSAGMVPPQRMAEVVRTVLSLQRGLVLVSLRNLPPTRLPADAPGATPADGPRPYVHTVELVVEGQYLDLLAYFEALEALPWRFYWQHLELTTTHYPTSRVRLELGTISLDSEWIDL